MIVNRSIFRFKLYCPVIVRYRSLVIFKPKFSITTIKIRFSKIWIQLYCNIEISKTTRLIAKLGFGKSSATVSIRKFLVKFDSLIGIIQTPWIIFQLDFCPRPGQVSIGKPWVQGNGGVCILQSALLVINIALCIPSFAVCLCIFRIQLNCFSEIRYGTPIIMNLKLYVTTLVKPCSYRRWFSSHHHIACKHKRDKRHKKNWKMLHCSFVYWSAWITACW